MKADELKTITTDALDKAAALLDEGHRDQFTALLQTNGFKNVGIEPTRIYQFEDARAFLEGAGLDAEVLAREVSGCVMGAFIRATKPV